MSRLGGGRGRGSYYSTDQNDYQDYEAKRFITQSETTKQKNYPSLPKLPSSGVRWEGEGDDVPGAKDDAFIRELAGNLDDPKYLKKLLGTVPSELGKLDKYRPPVSGGRTDVSYDRYFRAARNASVVNALRSGRAVVPSNNSFENLADEEKSSYLITAVGDLDHPTIVGAPTVFDVVEKSDYNEYNVFTMDRLQWAMKASQNPEEYLGLNINEAYRFAKYDKNFVEWLGMATGKNDVNEVLKAMQVDEYVPGESGQPTNSQLMELIYDFIHATDGQNGDFFDEHPSDEHSSWNRGRVYKYPGGGGGGGDNTNNSTSYNWTIVDYKIPGAPDWWTPVIPDQATDNSQLMAIVNMMIPYLSPEDQRTAATYLYQLDPTGFARYDPVTAGYAEAPKQVTLSMIQRMLGSDRAREAIGALEHLAQSMGRNPKEFGPGYAFLRRILSLGSDYLLGEEGRMPTRSDYVAYLEGLNPLMQEAQKGKLGSYGSLARMLSQPFYSAGDLMPLYKDKSGRYVFGKPDASLY